MFSHCVLGLGVGYGNLQASVSAPDISSYDQAGLDAAWAQLSAGLRSGRSVPRLEGEREMGRAGLQQAYTALLGLPAMPASPAQRELQHATSSEDERDWGYLYRRHGRDAGNLDMKKFELSAKYMESKGLYKNYVNTFIKPLVVHRV